MQVVIQNEPDSLVQTSPGFEEGSFDKLIWEKGYRIIYEKSLKCPCKSVRVNQLASCKNCGGTGYIFINPTETRMSITGMNKDTTFKEWSQENRGTAGISCLSTDVLCFMDKITVIESENLFNEVRHFVKTEDDKLFTYCSYLIKKIEYIGLYINDSTALQILKENVDYMTDNYRIYLDDSYLTDYVDENTYSITVRYYHQPQYLIIDANRSVMNSRNSFDRVEKEFKLPLHYIGRLAAFVLDMPNIANDRLIDNSYIDDKCSKTIVDVNSFAQICS